MNPNQSKNQTISNLNIEEVKKLLREYDKNKYSLVLADYPSRDQDYKNEIFLLIIENNTIPTENLKELVEYFLEKGAKVNHEDNDGWTALTLASYYEHSEVVKILLANSAEINHQTKRGDTALIVASEYGYLGIVKLLLTDNGGANLNLQNVRGHTALMTASYNEHPEVVNILLANSAEINRQDNGGWTALIWALNKGNLEIVRILLSSQEPEYIYEIDRLPQNIQKEIIQRVKEEAIKLNENPIELAAKASNLELVKLLLSD